MLNKWYILAFYLQFITSISSFNHCDAIRKSENNFTGQTVVFVQSYDDKDRKLEKVLHSFFECYANDLKILKISLKYFLFDEVCQVVETSWNRSIKPSGTEWRIIFSPFLFSTGCPFSNITSEVIKIAPSGFDHHFEILGICKNKQECHSFTVHLPIYEYIQYTFVEKTNKMYEQLEEIVDKKEIKPNKLRQKYHYFNKNGDLLGLSITLKAVLTLIAIFFFVLIGFFSCLYSLLSFALVEEDFRTRNDEREFLMGLARARHDENDTVQEEMAQEQEIEELPISEGNTDVHTERTQSTTRSPMSLKSTQMSELEPMLKRK